jgi:hypothetical protein
MAATNQRNKSGGRKERPQRSGSIKKRVAEAEEAMSAMREEVSDYVSHGASQVREMTRDHEGTAVLVALAAGFGVGLLIGAALAPRHQPRRWSDRLTAEGIGRRLLERVEGMIPDALSERLGR